MRSLIITTLVLSSGSAFALGQAVVYQPLGRYATSSSNPLVKWNKVLLSHSSQSTQSGRPVLPGLQNRNLELLQDGVMRKSPNKIKTRIAAGRHIMRMSGKRPGRNVLNGAMAEALFADHNPEFDYVRKSNAPQHDFTRSRVTGGRENVQVKFHEDGNPSKYALDMKKDWRAHRFAVPDDHVGALKAWLKKKYERLMAKGDVAGAKQAARNRGRVMGIGATSAEVSGAVKESARCAARERYAAYTSLGVALSLAVGPVVWDWANGDLPANQALYRGSRGLSLLGVGVAADVGLRSFKDGALRGTLKGNMIVGCAILVAETIWLLYEHGGSRAFYQSQFYESIGGSIGGLVFGIAGSGAAAAWVPGPGWVVGGATIVVGAAAGVVGYFGGRAATHMIIEMLNPKMLRKEQNRRLSEIRTGIEARLATTRAWPPSR
jgi:hypothetical protein